MDTVSRAEIFQFGSFLLDRRGGGLFRRADDGGRVPVGLGSRAVEVLAVLIERPGTLLAKDEIMAAVWPNTVVEEANLTMHISAIRRVLDADRKEVSCIQTVPGRGYRFVWTVTRVDEDQERFTSPSDVLTLVIAEPSDVSDTRPMGQPPDGPTSVAPRLFPAQLLAGLPSRYVAATGLALLVVIVALVAWTAMATRPPTWLVARAPDPPRLSVVVLPLQNFSAQPGTATSRTG